MTSAKSTKSRRSKFADPNYHDSTSSSEESDPTHQYLLLFGGLTLAQLTSTSPAPRFKFSSQDKVTALRHAVAHAYTSNCPPSLQLFLDLACRQLPVPTNHGLYVTEVCVHGLKGLIENVLTVAETNGLVRSENLGVSGWDIQVSTALTGWDGAGGWKAIQLPRSHPKSLAYKAHNSMSPYQGLVIQPSSDPSWARVVREVMHHFATNQAQPVSSTPITSTTSNPLAPPTQAYYTPSTYTDLPERERRNQAAAYAVFVAAARRLHASAATGNDNDTKKVLKKMLDWNNGDVVFIQGNDYVDWQREMLRKKLLDDVDFEEADLNPNP